MIPYWAAAFFCGTCLCLGFAIGVFYGVYYAGYKRGKGDWS